MRTAIRFSIRIPYSFALYIPGSFEQILPILDVKKDYKNQIEKELRWFIDTPYHNVPNFINLNKSKIKPSPYYKYLYIGNGNTVIDQEPAFGERIPEGGTIILYLN